MRGRKLRRELTERLQDEPSLENSERLTNHDDDVCAPPLVTLTTCESEWNKYKSENCIVTYKYQNQPRI